MARAIWLAAAMVSLVPFSAAAVERDSPQGQAALSLYRDIVGIRSAAGQGKVPEVAARIAADLKAAGFADEDIKIVPMGETAYLIARYRGSGKARPIAFLGHMDIVDARPADWQFDPFTLREEGGDFLGRGSLDNKLGVAQLTRAFADLKMAGFVPNRDLYLGFSGDEETGMATTRALVEVLKPMNVEFALNSDAGGGFLTPDGKAAAHGTQVAEKTFATFDVTITNPGGHSSRPRPDNAIYQLADLLKRVEAYRFPIEANAATRAQFRALASNMPADIAAVMRRFADNPADAEAGAALAANPETMHMIMTTCVATMLNAGHAENALPQRATATINCRIFPGTEVSTVADALKAAGGNPAAEWNVRDEPRASPVSEPRADVLAAVNKALAVDYPGVKTSIYQESGGTDGKWFRIAGIPTYGIGMVFMDPAKMRAHGLDENAPVASFYNGLDYWPVLIRELAGKKR